MQTFIEIANTITTITLAVSFIYAVIVFAQEALNVRKELRK